MTFRCLPVFSRSLASAAIAIWAATAGTARGAIVTNTSGVYDEASQANAVDQTATTPTAGTVSLVSLAQFKTDILTAVAIGEGGVVNFDDVATPVSGETSISALFGSGFSKTLTITGVSYQVDMSALATIGATPISGGNYLRNGSATGSQSFTFAIPALEVGATVLARTGARNITATVTYDDATTGTIGPVTVATVSGTGATSSPDTFFGFAAPSGKRITNLTLSAGTNNFFVVDDIGFVVPEPATAGTLAVVALGLLLRRRRAL